MNNEQLKNKKTCNLHFAFYIYPKNGFTLIEIIVVMLIIGIASGLVGIMVSKGTGSLELRTFTKDVSAVLRYARNHAVSEKKIYCLVIDKDKHTYVLFKEDTDYKQKEIVMNKNIPDELQMTVQDREEDSQYMEFFPRGNSSGGVIEINNEEGTAFFIIINRITGKLKVEKAE